MKKEQEKIEKGARGKKFKGAGSKGRNCNRSKEHGPSLTEAHYLNLHICPIVPTVFCVSFPIIQINFGQPG